MMQPSHLSVSAANVRRRLTKDSVSELMHGPPAPKYRYDHHKDNLRKLGELARDAAARREEEAAPPPEPFKLSRFAHVESRLAQSGVRARASARACECASAQACGHASARSELQPLRTTLPLLLNALTSNEQI